MSKMNGLSFEMKGQFSEVHGRFAQVDGKLSHIDGRFSEIDGRFAEVNGRFDEMNGRFDEMNGRFDRLEGQIHAAIQEMKAQSHRFGLMFEEQSERNKFVLDGYASLYDRQDRLEVEVKQIQKQNKQ